MRLVRVRVLGRSARHDSTPSDPQRVVFCCLENTVRNRRTRSNNLETDISTSCEVVLHTRNRENYRQEEGREREVERNDFLLRKKLMPRCPRIDLSVFMLFSHEPIFSRECFGVKFRARYAITVVVVF